MPQLMVRLSTTTGPAPAKQMQSGALAYETLPMHCTQALAPLLVAKAVEEQYSHVMDCAAALKVPALHSQHWFW
jgi:hypothetical protein